MRRREREPATKISYGGNEEGGINYSHRKLIFVHLAEISLSDCV